jgi:hypothetical protein
MKKFFRKSSPIRKGRDTIIKEQTTTIAEDRKIIEEKDKENAELIEQLAEMECLLRNRQV